MYCTPYVTKTILHYDDTKTISDLFSVEVEDLEEFLPVNHNLLSFTQSHLRQQLPELHIWETHAEVVQHLPKLCLCYHPIFSLIECREGLEKQNTWAVFKIYFF